MGQAASDRLFVRGHECADPGFGIWPKPAASAQLAHKLPVIGGFATKVALGHFVGFDERINF